MPTMDEIKAELKKRGVRGYSGKKKPELEEMLKNAPAEKKKVGKSVDELKKQLGNVNDAQLKKAVIDEKRRNEPARIARREALALKSLPAEEVIKTPKGSLIGLSKPIAEAIKPKKSERTLKAESLAGIKINRKAKEKLGSVGLTAKREEPDWLKQAGNEILPTGYQYGNQIISGISEPKWLKEAGRSTEANAVENIQRIARGRIAKNPEKVNYRGWVPKAEDMETFEPGGYNRVRTDKEANAGIFQEHTHEHDYNPVNAPRGGFPMGSKLDREVGRWKGNRVETAYYLLKLHSVIVEGKKSDDDNRDLLYRRRGNPAGNPDKLKEEIEEYVDKHKLSNDAVKKAEKKAKEFSKTMMAKDKAVDDDMKRKGIGEYTKERIEMDALARYKIGGKLNKKAQDLKDKLDKADKTLKEKKEHRSIKLKELTQKGRDERQKLKDEGADFDDRHFVNKKYVLKDLKAQKHLDKQNKRMEELQKHYDDDIKKWDKYYWEMNALFKKASPASLDWDDIYGPYDTLHGKIKYKDRRYAK